MFGSLSEHHQAKLLHFQQWNCHQDCWREHSRVSTSNEIHVHV